MFRPDNNRISVQLIATVVTLPFILKNKKNIVYFFLSFSLIFMSVAVQVSPTV